MDSVVPVKIVIVGDGACGKSALLLAYTKKAYDDKYIPTVVDTYEVTMTLVNLPDSRLKLTVVDTAGQEDFANIRAISLKGADSTILCYTVDNASSLDNAKTLWVKEIRQEDKKLPFVLVGNKADIFSKQDPDHVSPKAAKQAGQSVRAYAVLQCSAKEYGESEGKKGNVDSVFTTAIRCGLVKQGLITESSPCCTLL